MNWIMRKKIKKQASDFRKEEGKLIEQQYIRDHSFMLHEKINVLIKGKVFGEAEIISVDLIYAYKIGYIPYYTVRFDTGEKVDFKCDFLQKIK